MPPENRVLVGLPKRLEDAKRELRRNEHLVESIKTLYSQRLTLTDKAVLDNIGEILNLPKIEDNSNSECDHPEGTRDICRTEEWPCSIHDSRATADQDRALGEALRENYPDQFGGPIA